MRKCALLLIASGAAMLAGCGGRAEELPDDPVSRCTRFVEHLQALECADTILTTASCAALADIDPDLVPDYDCLIAATYCDGAELVQPAADACE